MTKPLRSDEAAESKILERLLLVTKEHSRAEIARRTGFPKYQVSRYLSGTKIPASFCAELSSQLGINPVWLLTGEGALRLDDISDDIQPLSRKLTELVATMNHAQRMKIGALAGKNQLKALRNLDDSLQGYNNAQKQLSDIISPILEDSISKLHKATESRQQVQARTLRDACIQASRLSLDEQLSITLDYELANYESVYGTSMESARFLRRGLQKHVFIGNTIDEEFMYRQIRLCRSLLAMRQDLEATRVAKIAIALAYKNKTLASSVAELKMILAFLDLEQGRGRRALKTAQAHYDQLRLKHKELQRQLVWRIQVFSGLMTLDDAFNFRDISAIEKVSLAAMAIMSDDVNTLRKRLPFLFRDQRFYSEERGFLLFYAKLLTKTDKGESKQLTQDLNSRIERDISTANLPQPVKNLESEVMRCQICRLCGDQRGALKHLDNSIDYEDVLAPNLSMRLGVRIIMWRNVIGLFANRKLTEKRLRALRKTKRSIRRFKRNGYVGLPTFACHT